jgi:hypothetical protein
MHREGEKEREINKNYYGFFFRVTELNQQDLLPIHFNKEKDNIEIDCYITTKSNRKKV